MRWIALGWVGLTFVALLGCDDQPCLRYVDYMCACHDGENGVSCEELQQTYAGASPSVQDQCAIDLADQQDADDAAGLQCDSP